MVSVYHQAVEVPQPADGALNDPAPPVPMQLPAILRGPKSTTWLPSKQVGTFTVAVSLAWFTYSKHWRSSTQPLRQQSASMGSRIGKIQIQKPGGRDHPLTSIETEIRNTWSCTRLVLRTSRRRG